MPPPPPVNDTTLSKSYSLLKFSVHTSTQISSRTSAVLKNLQPQGPSPQQQTEEPSQNKNDRSTNNNDNDKPILIALTASQPNATNKLITIVEIAKRELAAKQTKCFQYNALSSEVADVPRRKKVKGGKDGGGSESEGAFEAMGENELGETKKRNVPSLTVYLSLSSVRELKVAYGEQV